MSELKPIAPAGSEGDVPRTPAWLDISYFKSLHDQGVLSDEELKEKKRSLLGKF